MANLRLLLASLICCTSAYASAAPAQSDTKQFIDSLHPQHGNVTLPNEIATIKLSDEFYYLLPQDAEKVLTGWGNPPGQNTQGMIMPAGVNPMSTDGWGVVISYTKDGHVSDEDAAKIDYSKLLKDMQESTEANNDERKKQGYTPLHLMNWAEKPSYDAGTHKMYWAKVLKDDNQTASLNYSTRVLGRDGVLNLNAVAGLEQLATIKPEMDKVLAFTDLNPGQRYADYNPTSDKLAEYGLAGLVAGGIAAKAGLFAKIGLFLLAAKKLLVIGLLGVVAVFKSAFGRIFGRKN